MTAGPRPRLGKHGVVAAGIGLAWALCAPAAWPSAQLALDKGCYNCHGTPPRKGTPSFASLVAEYAKARDQPEALRALVARLHKGSLFSHIAAHERLSDDEALRLVRWIAEGAP
jgi:cytochrome c